MLTIIPVNMAGQNPGSPTDFQYFYEDEVYKINNHGQVVFGLVLENYEANSSDQESDIETPIQKGEIRVVWHPSGTERVISEKTVGLADRSLMPGDVVRRLIAGKDTQRGYCRDIVMTAALQIVGTKHVIPSVASERLQPLEEFTPDLAVCLDSWVGTSKAVNSKLRLVSSDGSRLEYPDLDNCPLEDYSMRRRRSTPYSSSEFYPGQMVFGPLGALDSEDLKNLKLLNVFEPCTLQVGDRNFLTIGAEDTFISKQQWRKQQSKYYRSIRKQTRPSKKSSKESAEHMPGLSKSHVHSPEPHKGDCLHNGDSKAELALNDDDSDNWENTSSDGSDTDSGATWSSRCSSAASQRGKRSPQLAVRLLRGKRLKRTARRAPPAPPPRLGDRVVVETLHTTSRANVVWQVCGTQLLDPAYISPVSSRCSSAV
ncbi:hypothetical protein MSG28_003994 [Choristoneura fumiferana]|uniref:Uncharacterized protein n=2 Tax=Choristoneura fumiferana TaxID=7141 RepID=A0ACC0KGW7_CHOFU|nr:hypothetical protein MSG28_003994 [Choristoneura fumiferana]